ncbi:MAG: hypothetical protein LBP93_07080 [Treponema sp.]|jgi:hypothetical protein|nr:hypothetical protein [Treponema sp.]
MLNLMKKPMFPRIIALVFIYGIIFLLLVMIQFTRQGAFTCKAGDLIVSGYYREPPADSSSPPGAYLLTNGASVFFGGLEFRMEDRSGFALHYEDGGAEKIVPEYMVLTEDAASFRLPGGSELNFSTRGPTGKAELRISGSFDDHVQRLELPYRLLRNSRMRKSEDGKVRITAGGTDYAFEAAELDTASRTLAITAGGAAVSYRAVPENKSFIPDDLVIPAALDLEEYEALLTQWRDQAFALWSQAVKTANDEAVVTAYLGESIRRGGYKAAVSSISPAFLNGERRTFASSVYLGRLDIGLRSLSAAERDKQSRLSRLILDEKSPDFLGEPHVFAYLETRHNTALINGGIEIVRDLDPSSLSPDRAPGILEGWYDWHLYRPNEENPFARLLDQACFAIAAAAQKSPPGDRLFVFSGTSADTEFNLRLGKALTLYGETAGNKTWAALGRSLILSVLSLADASGTLPEAVSSGEDAESPRRLDSAGIYRFLASGTYPHAVTIGHPPEGVWAWTVAQVSSVRENNVLDISVSFSEGETHYMIIRGIRPFSKIQLYGIDYRTDPQFERYDSSGWSYSSSEQTLLVKMRHRAAVEHIRIYS